MSRETLDRLCWWCNGPLMAISHAEVPDPDGNILQVHCVCEPSVKQMFKPVTAQPGKIRAFEPS